MRKAINPALMMMEIANNASTCLLKSRSVAIKFFQYFQSATCRGDAWPCLRKSVKKLTVVFLLSINAYITVNNVKNIPDNPKNTLYIAIQNLFVKILLIFMNFH